MGDLVPNTSIINRGMGGVAAAYVDYDKRYDERGIPKVQTVNFLNPASYSRMRITSFDLGFEVDSRTINSVSQGDKFNSKSAIISYVQLGLPLNRKHGLGMTLGLRPVTRVNYKIQRDEKLAGFDSITHLFEGIGGSYQVYAGMGKSFKNFSIGFNTGYFFGTKDYSTRNIYLPDSADNIYYKANYETKATFGGIFLDLGAQYQAQLNKTTILHLGAYGTVKRKYNANKDTEVNTYNYDANGGIYRVDSVYSLNGQKGELMYPATIGGGFMLEKIDKWQIGADFTTTSWSDYQFFGQKDSTAKSWLIKVGGQVTPNLYSATSYWSRVTYRAGFYFGPDYIHVGKELPQFGASAGFGLPVRKNPYTNQFSYINISLEYGKRGNKDNLISENLFRVAAGFTLSDLWFIKRKYN
ncbi:MAG: hypothetical protein INR73_19515 [Williamsia sp.]|nr:hypothetical protein [Williamsia sp.]